MLRTINKKLTAISHASDRVRVHTDGTSYFGDFVAGADDICVRCSKDSGVYEKLRGSIHYQSTLEIRPAMFTEYKCIIGISYCLPQLPISHLGFLP